MFLIGKGERLRLILKKHSKQSQTELDKVSNRQEINILFVAGTGTGQEDGMTPKNGDIWGQFEVCVCVCVCVFTFKKKSCFLNMQILILANFQGTV